MLENHDNFPSMKFLKVLFNSLLSGIFFSLLLSLLVFNLNINLSLRPSSFAHLLPFIVLTYGTAVTVLFLVIFFLLQFFSNRKFNVAFLSPTFLSLSFSSLLFLFLFIFHANFRYFSSFFSSPVRKILTAQMAAFFFLAILGVLFCYACYRHKRKFFILGIYYIIFLAILGCAFLLRLKYPQPQKQERQVNLEARRIEKKITIIGLEGLSFDFIIPLISQGKLPNFSWLVENGSWGRLVNFTPNEAVVLNQSFNTGKYPFQHLQLSPTSYSFGRSQAKFEVLPRFILFKQMARVGLLKISPRELTAKTKDIWEIFRENNITFLKKDWPYGADFSPLNPKSEKLFSLYFKDLKYETSSLMTIARQVFYRDFEYEEKSSQEKNELKPQFYYLLLNGLNIVETFFYKYSFPDLYGNIKQEELNKYGLVIEKYYQFYDQIISRYLAALKEDELFIVYSPHGIEPLPLWRRFVEWMLGNPHVSAYHENAPDGVVFFLGKGINKGKNIEPVKLVDIAPTLLYYLGLPVGKDMDGIVRSSLFLKEFTSENPIFYISSYEEVQIKSR